MLTQNRTAVIKISCLAMLGNDPVSFFIQLMGLAVVWGGNSSVKATPNHFEEAGYSFIG